MCRVVRWHLKNGLSGSGWVHRCTPPLDDLLIHLPADGLVQRSFVLACAPTEDGAFKCANHWFFEPSPLTEQIRQFSDWCTHNTLLFDAADPWLTRLFAHCQALRWRGISPHGIARLPQSDFANGDFDAPSESCAAWDTLVVERLIGAQLLEGSLVLTPDNFLGLTHFCLQGFHDTTIVWDDPTHPHDAYEDGDKGLTVYLGRTRLYNQSTLTPLTLPLPKRRRP